MLKTDVASQNLQIRALPGFWLSYNNVSCLEATNIARVQPLHDTSCSAVSIPHANHDTSVEIPSTPSPLTPLLLWFSRVLPSHLMSQTFLTCLVAVCVSQVQRMQMKLWPICTLHFCWIGFSLAGDSSFSFKGEKKQHTLVLTWQLL